MANEGDFDALSKKASQSNGAIEDLNNLSQQIFALPQWHFIARGAMPNIHPYVASNAAYAGGQQMVRAFTDTDRLLRFAQENHLTNADGSATLLSLPTDTIIDYLEQFMADGVHGIWFNSDTQSEGFFFPLKQLRPIKDHLEKIKQSQNEVTVNDMPGDSRDGFGLSLHDPDGHIDIILDFFVQGTVRPDTTLGPFYRTLVPLLEDYQGTGEFQELLALDTQAMSDLAENVAENAHGPLLKIRKFLYSPANTGASVAFHSFESNQLRHLQTQGKVVVQVVLCQNLADATTKLYVRFSGHGRDVVSLKNAVIPLLENCGFQLLS